MTTLIRRVSILLGLVLLAPMAFAQSGHVLNGVGPTDQGMSGAGMAAPQDASTALHWNPASIFAVPGRTLDIGLQVMKPSGSLASSVDVGAFGMLPDGQGGTIPFPWQGLQGTTSSEPGVFPIPSVGYISTREDSRFAYGLSAFGVGGFGVDYALSSADLRTGALPDNPLLSPQQAESGIGFGALSSTFMLMQISPTVAYRITDDIWLGLSPTINVASLELSVFPATSPQMFANPMDPSGQSFLALYPDAPASWATGFGVQAGLHANTSFGLGIGASIKSKQNFEKFSFEPTTDGAAPYTFTLDYPMVASAGIAYTGIDRLLLAADVRYLDFENADGFDEVGFGPSGEVLGFGWNSITIMAIGAQYEIMDGLPIRVGYSFNDNPIDGNCAFFNTPAPAIIEQHVSAGASYRINNQITASIAGQLGLANEVSGSWMTINPADGSTVPIQGTSVTNKLSTFTVIGGVSVKL